MTRVLAIDPGLKSGVCLIDTDCFEDVALKIIHNGLGGFHSWWQTDGAFLEYDALVVESFEPEEGTHGIDLTPVEIIGWLQGLRIPIVWQRRMQRGNDKLVSTAVLKRAGLYPKRGELKEGHQVAALQHALAYLIRQRHRPTLELLHPKEES